MRSGSREILFAALAVMAACDGTTIVLGPTDPGTTHADVAEVASGVDTAGAADAVEPETAVDTARPDPGTVKTCIANNDGRIDADELPVALGAAPSFTANGYGTVVDVDVDGVDTADGRVWDFTDGPTDVTTSMYVKAPGGYWFEPLFPGASFVSPLSAQDPSVLGVYQADTKGVRLMGIASEEENGPTGKTIVVYDSPVPLFEFPLVLNNVYSVKSSFKDALLYNVPNAGQETYKTTVDAVGTLKLPAFTLKNTLRLRIEVSQKFVVSTSPDPIPSIQYLWVHECLGEAARISSPVGTTDPHFKQAKEFRRIGF